MAENSETLAAPVIDQTLPGGLRFVGERVERSHAVALALRIPAGSKDDPLNKFGLAHLVQETVLLGTRRHNAHALSDAFDFHGIRQGAFTTTEFTGFELRFLPEHLEQAVSLLREVLSEPAFPPKECETAKLQAIQEIKQLEDDPLTKVFVVLKELYLGAEWGHFEVGTESSVPELTRGDVQAFWQARYIPAGTVVSAAGRFDFDLLLRPLETLFGNTGQAWQAEAPPAFSGRCTRHIPTDNEQTQIALAFPCVPRTDPAYYAARTAIGVLSAGSSGRLFTEIREKRGLAYAVGAQNMSLRGAGVAVVYAGTTAARAAETFDVLKAELANLPTDLAQDELERAKAVFKAQLVMDQESTIARGRALLDDVYSEGRALPIGELVGKIDAVSIDDIKQYWQTHPFEPYALVTLGREALE